MKKQIENTNNGKFVLINLLVVNVLKNLLILVLLFTGIFFLLSFFFPYMGTLSVEEFINLISISFSTSLLFFSIIAVLKKTNISIKILIPIYIIYFIQSVDILKNNGRGISFISVMIFFLTSLLFLFFIKQSKNNSKNYALNILMPIIIIVSLFLLAFII
jgi:hypothetical protein